MKTLDIYHPDHEIKRTGTGKREGSFRLSKILAMILIIVVSFLVTSCYVELEPENDYDHDRYEHHHHEYYEHHDRDYDFDMDRHHGDGDR
jgi:hypothetical protein